MLNIYVSQWSGLWEIVLSTLQHKLKNQGRIHEAETRQQKEEKVVRQEKETKKVPQTTRVERDSRLNYEVQ